MEKMESIITSPDAKELMAIAQMYTLYSAFGGLGKKETQKALSEVEETLAYTAQFPSALVRLIQEEAARCDFQDIGKILESAAARASALAPNARQSLEVKFSDGSSEEDDSVQDPRVCRKP